MKDEQLYKLYRRVCAYYDERGEDLNRFEFIEHKHKIIQNMFYDQEFADVAEEARTAALATAMFYFVTALSRDYSDSTPSTNYLDALGRLLVRIKLEESNEH